MNNSVTLSGLKREDFTRVVDGKETDLYVLTNSHGLELAVTNYGCAILSWMTPDQNGTMANIIQGHDSLEHLMESEVSVLSTTIGRYGNRIADGKFTLDGKVYTLEQNNGKNSLHGGSGGFHKRVWDVIEQTPDTVTFHYEAQDGEEGFPGCMKIDMSYTLNEEDALVIRYKATTDRKTLVNLTNHAFFSLSGVGCPTPSAENNVVTINADFYLPTDNTSIPTGEIRKVEGTPMDFRTPHVIGERINEPFEQLVFGKGYDHCYILNKVEAGEESFAATCTDPISGRSLDVYTTEPGMQFYTANWNNGMTGALGNTFPDRSSVCFEAQHFPDTPNRSYFPTAVLNPGETYTQVTTYKFSVKK